MTVRHLLAAKLRRFADRIDHAGAPKAIGYSFTFERGRGIVFHDSHNKGCPLWYLRDADYDLAYERATDPPAQINWETMALKRRHRLPTELVTPEQMRPAWKNNDEEMP